MRCFRDLKILLLNNTDSSIILEFCEELTFKINMNYHINYSFLKIRLYEKSSNY